MEWSSVSNALVRSRNMPTVWSFSINCICDYIVQIVDCHICRVFFAKAKLIWAENFVKSSNIVFAFGQLCVRDEYWVAHISRYTGMWRSNGLIFHKKSVWPTHGSHFPTKNFPIYGCFFATKSTFSGVLHVNTRKSWKFSYSRKSLKMSTFFCQNDH